jgi:hypothetical protein
VGRGELKKEKKSNAWVPSSIEDEYRGWMDARENCIEERISMTRTKCSF